MNKLFFFLVLFLISSKILAQPYPEVTIMDIQYQDISGLLIYFDNDSASAYEGDTVTITGMVMVPPYKSANPDSTVLMYVGAGAAGFYIQDTSATDWASILLRIEAVNNYPAFKLLDSGTVVKVTGYVNEYSTSTQKTTQFNLIDFTGSEVIDFKPRPQPVELTLDSLKDSLNVNKAISEKWEGVYVIIRNVTTFDRNSSGGFRIFDSNNRQLTIGTKSNYYYQKPAPADGTVLEYIKGYIETRSEASGGVTLNPGFRDDMKVLSYPPAITNLVREPVEVGYGDPVTISASISDLDGTVSEAKLFYRKNKGVNNELTMTNSGGNNYQAVIPAQNDSSVVDFFVRAVDNDNNVTLYPADTSKNRFFYLVLNRQLTIQDIQYSPFGGGFSGYNSYEVTVRGIVSADTTDIEGNETGSPSGPQVYMQNGSGLWSGIRINGTETLTLQRGDDVTVTGTVRDDFGMTEISGIDNPSNITIHSTGNPVPDPEILSTATIDLLTGGTVQAEQWEGVLIKYEDITVTDENADGDPGPDPGSGSSRNYGDILVADASNSNARIALQYGSHDYHNYWFAGMDTIPNYVRQGNTFESVAGILWFGFGNYRLFPRKNDDFVGWVTDVEYDNVVPSEFALLQNYPNPFNPSTKIEYSLPVEGNVTLKIFNILGQEVRTLINNELMSAGRHTVTFEASSLPSGIYIYRLQTGNFSSNKKMILLK